MGITSIWDNNFFNKPPQPKWAFEVDFSQFVSMTDDEKKLAQQAVQTAKINERQVELIPIYYGGVCFRHMARANTEGELTIKFAESQDLDVYTLLNNIFNQTAYNNKYPNNTGKEDDINYRKVNKENKICIKILKPDDNFVYKTDTTNYSKKFIYNNCQIMTISDVDLDYGDNDGVFEYEVTFSYDYMTIESLEEKGNNQ